MTLIPLDFLHNHQSSQTQLSCSKDKTQPNCGHKLHITKKADFCWACAVHFDKTFSKVTLSDKLKPTAELSLLIRNDIAGYVIEILLAGLRGPPTE